MYCYYVVYNYKTRLGEAGLGICETRRINPIKTITDILQVAQDIKDDNAFTQVMITNWKELEYKKEE